MDLSNIKSYTLAVPKLIKTDGVVTGAELLIRTDDKKAAEIDALTDEYYQELANYRIEYQSEASNKINSLNESISTYKSQYQDSLAKADERNVNHIIRVNGKISGMQFENGQTVLKANIPLSPNGSSDISQVLSAFYEKYGRGSVTIESYENSASGPTFSQAMTEFNGGDYHQMIRRNFQFQISEAERELHKEKEAREADPRKVVYYVT